MKQKRLISFSAPEWAFLQSRARALGLSASEVVRRVVDAEMARVEQRKMREVRR